MGLIKEKVSRSRGLFKEKELNDLFKLRTYMCIAQNYLEQLNLDEVHNVSKKFKKGSKQYEFAQPFLEGEINSVDNLVQSLFRVYNNLYVNWIVKSKVLNSAVKLEKYNSEVSNLLHKEIKIDNIYKELENLKHFLERINSNGLNDKINLALTNLEDSLEKVGTGVVAEKIFGYDFSNYDVEVSDYKF